MAISLGESVRDTPLHRYPPDSRTEGPVINYVKGGGGGSSFISTKRGKVSTPFKEGKGARKVLPCVWVGGGGRKKLRTHDFADFAIF